MTERLRTGNYANSEKISAKMSNDLTPRKTMLILVIVVGCFAVLWPKVFYPILVGSANQHIKPSPIDKTTGCCDVISETDVHTIKIMSELCKTIIKRDEDLPLTGRELVAKCQSAVLETCGIDISAVLQEQVRLGHSVKQIINEVRSLNGSLCLKYNFGVAPWRLGVPHRVTIKVLPSDNIKQERPLQLRSELVHPAFRERGRAIPQPQVTKPSRPSIRIVEGRPGPIPGMRPTLGGAGHVVPPPKQGTGSMGLIMPIYTIGIVIFFTYTVMKIVFKKQPEALYPPVEPDPAFRKEIFEPERSYTGPKLTREGVTSKLVVNAMSALLDEVDEEIESRRKASEVAEQDAAVNGNVNPQEEEQPSVKVLGMEMTASCEGGKKWSRPESPVLSSSPPPPPDPVEPPQEIFLEGALPAQSHLLVSDSATEAQNTNSEEDPAIVLAGKMTLSVISIDPSENGIDELANSNRKQEDGSSNNISEMFQKTQADLPLEDQITDLVKVQNLMGSVDDSEDINLLKEIENDIKDINNRNNIDGLNEFEKVEIESIGNKDISVVLDDLNQGNINFTAELAQINNESIMKENHLAPNIEKDDISTGNVESTTELVQYKEELEQEPSENTDKVEVLEIKEQEKYDETNHGKNKSEENEELLGEHASSLLEVANENLLEDEESSTNEKRATTSIVGSGAHEDENGKSGKENSPTTISNNGLGNVQEKNDSQSSPNDKNIKLELEKDTFNIVKDEGSNSDIIEQSEPIETVSAAEKTTVDIINDISGEKVKPMEEFVPEEEIEYEYENDDNELLDNEIADIERLNEISDQGDIVRINGDDHEQSKSGILAENDISDDEDLEDEDEEEEIEEIIEYVTDDEDDDEVEEIVQPGNRNDVAYRNERSGAQE